MKYVVKLFINEMVTFGLCFALIGIASVAIALMVGASSYDEGYAIGLQVGAVGGIIMRIAMIVVAIVTVIKLRKQD